MQTERNHVVAPKPHYPGVTYSVVGPNTVEALCQSTGQGVALASTGRTIRERPLHLQCREIDTFEHTTHPSLRIVRPCAHIHENMSAQLQREKEVISYLCTDTRSKKGTQFPADARSRASCVNAAHRVCYQGNTLLYRICVRVLRACGSGSIVSRV